MILVYPDQLESIRESQIVLGFDFFVLQYFRKRDICEGPHIRSLVFQFCEVENIGGRKDV